MTATIRPRSVLALPIANVAIPTTLIVLILLLGGLLTGGILYLLIYLVGRLRDRKRT